jgi:hypothetical protein
MRTTYVIQKRHPDVGLEWVNYRRWHDRVESPQYANLGDALMEVRRLILNAETTQYRLIERTELEIPLTEHP